MVDYDKSSTDSINSPCHRNNTIKRIVLILFIIDVSISVFILLLYLNTELLVLKDFYFIEEIICFVFVPISLIFNKYITILPIKKGVEKITVFPYFLIMVIISLVLTFCFIGNRFQVSDDYSTRIIQAIIIIFYVFMFITILITNKKNVTIKGVIVISFLMLFPSILFPFSCLYITTPVKGEREFVNVLELRVVGKEPSNKYYATILFRNDNVNEIGINKFQYDNIVAGNPISVTYKKAILGVEFIELKTNIGE